MYFVCLSSTLLFMLNANHMRVEKFNYTHHEMIGGVRYKKSCLVLKIILLTGTEGLLYYSGFGRYCVNKSTVFVCTVVNCMLPICY